MSHLTICDDRVCVQCGKAFNRRRHPSGTLEALFRFNLRKYCSHTCAAMIHGMDVEWPQEHAAMLGDCLASGMSRGKAAEAINRRFGTNYSRNAAIGKASRLGLKSTLARGKRPEISFPIHAGGRLVAPPKPAPRPRPLSASVPKLPREEITLRCAAIEPLNHSLLEVTGCRWPCGGWPDNTPVTFCGHVQLAGSSYCLEHTRLSWGPGSYAERWAHRAVRT